MTLEYTVYEYTYDNTGNISLAQNVHACIMDEFTNETLDSVYSTYVRMSQILHVRTYNVCTCLSECHKFYFVYMHVRTRVNG